MKITFLCLIVFISGTSARLILNKTNSSSGEKSGQDQKISGDFPEDFFSDEVSQFIIDY